ncbi:TPA: hypothetical protein SLF30_000494 [Acinetobacter baumannii]|nr:hypothetical protein [Acinetobacter baumannii]
MDNYKINAKDAVESLEIQGLFEQLGYMRAWDKNKVCFEPNHIFAKDGVLTWLHNDPILFEKHVGKELTLPQLRDLVVLKRNDVKDATHVDPGGTKHVEIDGRWYWFHEESTPDIQFGWVESAAYREYDDNVLKPITQPQDPALISGADALRALAEGKEVECQNKSTFEWFNCLSLSVAELVEGSCMYRIKPQTIKLELEIPAPYKAKIGGRDDTSFVLNVGRHQYCYKTEEDYTKARDALEAVFDAAVRGTNS